MKEVVMCIVACYLFEFICLCTGLLDWILILLDDIREFVVSKFEKGGRIK